MHAGWMKRHRVLAMMIHGDCTAAVAELPVLTEQAMREEWQPAMGGNPELVLKEERRDPDP